MNEYLVIGSGRWAQHLQKSFALAGIAYDSWSRRTHNESDLAKKITQTRRIWLAISDQALTEWVKKLASFNKLLLHSSGALEIAGAHSVHPLMSFAPDLYEDAFYPRYAFVTTSDLSRESLLAGLPNPCFRIPAESKTFYHALCVLAGNGSVLLWQKFFSDLGRLGIQRESLQLYAQQIFENLIRNPEAALTGPLVRGDQDTLDKDLRALNADPFQPVLSSLIKAFQQNGKELL